MFTDFTPWSALGGGALVGLSASLLLASHGKVAGISGLFGGLLRRERSDLALRAWFVGGLLVAGALLRLVAPQLLSGGWTASFPATLAAGIFVGFGTQLGNGCTSGHGVCGLSRLSIRSLVATLSFMGAGFATVYVARHLLGGGR